MPDASPSRLSRLYTYSKDSAFDAQENFTIEALAMAIDDDAGPMVDALKRLNPQEASRVGLTVQEGRTIRPSTQVVLEGEGRLDLVLEARERGGLIGAVWVEVKIGAPESGNQLDAYRRCIAAADYEVWLVTLAPAALRDDVDHLSWNELYRSARHPRNPQRSWRDLLAFLEEQNVSNDALGPISDAEAASLEPAYQLAQKVSEVVRVIHRELPELFGEEFEATGLWWRRKEGELMNFVGANFRTAGELWGQGNALRYGLTAHDGRAYWTVAVQPGRSHRKTEDRARKLAAEAHFSVEWERPASGPSILVARTRATAIDSHEAAVDWFRSRLRELAESRVLDVLVLGHGPAEPGANT
ncbi:MAG TPA: hypothetical protein VFO58_19800 [Vicinamibacterales bacterium]|nr:hypothetical protein [Vicinamibacterales bacterium]